MFKLIGVLLITAGCSGIGFSLKRDLCRRLAQLDELIHIFELLGSEIGCYKENLPGACREAAGRTKEPYQSCLYKISEEIETGGGRTFGEVWEDRWEECLRGTEITAKDKRAVLQFGRNCGYMDIMLQESNIRKAGQELMCAADRLKQEIENRGRVYTSLGVAGGLVLAIMLF